MLSYHPGQDPYHGAFRQLVLLTESETGFIRDALRILDFYYLYPELLQDIRFPREHVGWRQQLPRKQNPYWYSGNPNMVFMEMEPLFSSATSMLYGKSLLDTEAFEEGLLVRDESDLSDSLRYAISEAVAAESDLIEFLCEVLGTLPLQGSQGLKSRTGLMDSKYDPV